MREFRLKVPIKGDRIPGTDSLPGFFQTLYQFLQRVARQGKNHLVILGHGEYSVSHPGNSRTRSPGFEGGDEIFRAFHLSPKISVNTSPMEIPTSTRIMPMT